MLPLLDTGEALLLRDAILLPTRIKLDQPAGKPDATRAFWREWGTVQPLWSAFVARCERSDRTEHLQAAGNEGLPIGD